MYVHSFFIFYIPMQSSFFARAWFSYKWENHQNCRSHKLAISDSNLTCDPIFENGFKWCFDWWKNKVNPTIILEITEGWSSFSHWHLAPQITRLSRIPSYVTHLVSPVSALYRAPSRWLARLSRHRAFLWKYLTYSSFLLKHEWNIVLIMAKLLHWPKRKKILLTANIWYKIL